MEFLIYLDVCCLNRPFDDQTQERIRLEAEAIRLIFEHCQSGEWLLLTSEIIDIELRRTPEGARKEQMWLWTALAITKVNINPSCGLSSTNLLFQAIAHFKVLVARRATNTLT